MDHLSISFGTEGISSLQTISADAELSSCLSGAHSGFKLRTLLRWHATKRVKWVPSTSVGLSSTETLLLHWEDCQDHPGAPASYTNVSRTLKSLFIISMRSVDIPRAHMDESHGITIVATVSPHTLSIWPTSGPPRKGVADRENSFLLLGTAFSVEPVSPQRLLSLLLLWKQVSFA